MKINKKILNNKNLQKGLIAIGIIFVIFGLTFFTGFSLTGFAINSQDKIEKTAEIEVWANTFIEIKNKEDTIEAILFLDNNDVLNRQEIEFYLDGSLIRKEITNDKGYANFLMNLSEYNLGVHSLVIEFQGSSINYLNPSEIEKEIEISEKNGKRFMIFNGENYISEEIKNETVGIIPLEGFFCKEFQENIFWTSDYSQKPEGSTNYQTWYPQHNCSEIGDEECFIGNIDTNSRFMYPTLENSKKGEGYVQISNDEDICNNLESGFYGQTLAEEKNINEEEKRHKEYKKNNLETGNYFNYSACYGIKSYASQGVLVDTFIIINYTLCKEVKK